MIYWLGNDTPHWKNPRRHDPTQTPVGADPDILMPLTEDDVLEVAFGRDYSFRRVSRAAAINCTSRLALRVALARTSLNPKWKPWPHSDGAFLKQPASAANSGVIRIKESPETAMLRRYAPELADWGVIEQPVTSDLYPPYTMAHFQYEVDGAVIDGQITAWKPIIQWWNEDWTAIEKYSLAEPEQPPGLYYSVERAVRALGIDNAPFCFELRCPFLPITGGGDWKLIDAHCRLGEDGSAYRGVLAEAAGGDPFVVIDQLERDAVLRRASRP